MKQTFFDFLSAPGPTYLAYIAAYFEQHPEDTILVSDYNSFDNELFAMEMADLAPWDDAGERPHVLTATGLISQERNRQKVLTIGEEKYPYSNLNDDILITCCQVLHRKQLAAS